MSNGLNENEFVTGEVLVHFAAFWEPKLPKGETDPKKAKYGCCIIYDKSDTETHNGIKEIVNRLVAAVKVANGGRLPNGFRNPIHDGDTEREGDETFAGKYFFNCSSTRQPGMFYAGGKPIVIPSELFSGCFVQAHINFFSYNKQGNGIGVGLNNVLLIRKGEALGGAASTAASAFGFAPGTTTVEDDDEDFMK